MDKIIGILVVDDDASIRGVVEETLSDGGFEPAVAALGEEALSLLKANKYRALVVDISFGNDRIKGWDVARRSRAVDPSLPVIYITGGNADEWTVHGVPNSIVRLQSMQCWGFQCLSSGISAAGRPILIPVACFSETIHLETLQAVMR